MMGFGPPRKPSKVLQVRALPNSNFGARQASLPLHYQTFSKKAEALLVWDLSWTRNLIARSHGHGMVSLFLAFLSACVDVTNIMFFPCDLVNSSSWYCERGWARYSAHPSRTSRSPKTTFKQGMCSPFVGQLRKVNAQSVLDKLVMSTSCRAPSSRLALQRDVK